MKRFITSFLYAGRGMAHCMRREKNFRIQLIAAGLLITAGFIFQLTHIEWSLVVISMALVLSMEMINTAIEHVCNIIQPGIHPSIRIIKDIAAGAVLITAAGAAICASCIFIPKIILQFFNN